MKRTIITMVLILTILTFAGCGDTTGKANRTNSENAVDKVLNEQMENTDSAESSEETTESESIEITSESSESDTENLSASGDIDYDLTVMNSDMVYATVYQMLVNPDDYIGKTVKMSGPFYPYTNVDGTVYYPACIIEDATACCAQGMEFVLAGAEYPDDYPEMGTTITVTGTFETYQEDGYLYCHLVDAVLETQEQ